MNKLDQDGQAAKTLHEQIAKLSDKTKTYNQQRKDKVDCLRPLLQRVWAALEAGQVVNGCKGKEAWAHWYNPACRGTNAIRQIQRIINPHEATSRRPRFINLDKLGKLGVIMGGKRYMVTSTDTLMRVAKGFTGYTHVVGLNLNEIKVEHPAADEAVEPAAPKPASDKEALMAEEGQSASPGTTSRRRPAMHAQQASSSDPPNESGSKVAYEPVPGGPKVLEVAIPGEFPSDPSRLKYYVCAGEKAHPHPTLEEAKAHCDRLLAQHAQEAMPKPDASQVNSIKDVEVRPLHPAAEALKEALDSIDPIALGDEQQGGQRCEQLCDYTEEEVAQMFASGGND